MIAKFKPSQSSKMPKVSKATKAKVSRSKVTARPLPRPRKPARQPSISQGASTSQRASVGPGEDDEVSYRGSVLSLDADHLMEPVIDLDDEEDEDEDIDMPGLDEVDDEEEDEEEEDAEAELGKFLISIIQVNFIKFKDIVRLTKDWKSPIYTFFKPEPIIEEIDGRRAHTFYCNVKSCKNKTRAVRRYLDKGDGKSTSNLRTHAVKCWGLEAVEAANGVSLADARTATKKGKLCDGSITAAFERKGKGKVTYSHRQHTKAETKYVT